MCQSTGIRMSKMTEKLAKTWGGRRREGVFGEGRSWIKRRSVWQPSLWSSGNLHERLETRDPVQGAGEIIKSCGSVLRVQSPPAVMGFRAVLLSFLLLSLNWSRGAVITGVSEMILHANSFLLD